MAYTIGIDFGTTYCSVAIFKDDDVVILNKDFLIPSIVAFTDDDILFGVKAKEYTDDARNLVYDVKRIIGRDFKDKIITENIEKWPFIVRNNNDNPLIEIVTNNYLNRYIPVRIAGIIFEELKKIALKKYSPTCFDANIKGVIAVPTSFDEKTRAYILAAAQQASIDVLELISEPTAAAIAYGAMHKSEKEKKILVFDFGGGTLDISIILIKDTDVKVIVTGGDCYLGGRDIDEVLLEFVRNVIRKETKTIYHYDMNFEHKLLNMCENAKIHLSKATETTLKVESSKFKKEIKIEREEFLNISGIKYIFNRAKKCLENVFKDSPIDKTEIDVVIMVGGTSEIPYVRDMVQEFFDGKMKIDRENRYHDIAYGAAKYADKLTQYDDYRIKEYNTDCITALAIALEDCNNQIKVIFPKFNKIPDEIKISNPILPSRQNEVWMRFLEMKDETDKNKKILGEGQYILKAKIKDQVGYDLKCEINKNGLFTVAIETNNSSQVLFTSSIRKKLTSEKVEKVFSKSKDLSLLEKELDEFEFECEVMKYYDSLGAEIQENIETCEELLDLFKEQQKRLASFNDYKKVDNKRDQYKTCKEKYLNELKKLKI